MTVTEKSFCDNDAKREIEKIMGPAGIQTLRPSEYQKVEVFGGYQVFRFKSQNLFCGFNFSLSIVDVNLAQFHLQQKCL